MCAKNQKDISMPYIQSLPGLKRALRSQEGLRWIARWTPRQYANFGGMSTFLRVLSKVNQMRAQSKESRRGRDGMVQLAVADAGPVPSRASLTLEVIYSQ